MGVTTFLAVYLKKFADGHSECLPQLLSLISREMLFVPCRDDTAPNDRSPPELQTLTVELVEQEGFSAVQAYSSYEQMVHTHGLDVLFELVPGQTLCAAMPHTAGLVIDHGRPTEVVFTPFDVLEILENAEGYDELRAEASEPDTTDEFLAHIYEQLVDICKQYPEIEEAYFLNARSESAEATLGVLAETLPDRARFRLIKEVAKIAVSEYGFAGAIEVFDDLHLRESHSWELFLPLAPFYSRERHVQNPSKPEKSWA